jgi:hypothetical protein
MDMNVQAAIWRGLAQEAAKAAEQLKDPELRLSLLSIAEKYEGMAQRAEAMTGRDRSPIRVRPESRDSSLSLARNQVALDPPTVAPGAV